MSERSLKEIRPLSIKPHCLTHPEGSVLIAYGDTQVLCTASIEEKVPPWMANRGRGWVTAEYDMLPRATSSRSARDSHRGKINGRTQEICRLVGRSLRSVVDLKALGERTILIDCDVLQADGGTRTAAITGGYVALALSILYLKEKKLIAAEKLVLKDEVAAISVGVVAGENHLDLDYALDSRAEVDMNIIMTGQGELVEIQGTAESKPFSRQQLASLVDLAFSALPQLLQAQREALVLPYRYQSLLGG